jgi:hypothetical protein
MAWRKPSWAKSVFSSSAFLFGSARKKRPYRTRLLLEPLEDRCVPTTITPTTFTDGGSGSGSLRDAVLQFNADAGTEDDTIQLLPGTYTLTIRNTGGHHETAGLKGDLNLTQTSHRWIIQGAGPSTVVDASQLQDRVFQIVNPGTQVVFQDLVIQGGLAQEDGSDGALAGTTDALGGGILINGGDVTLEHVVIANNVARGGNGAPGNPGGDGHNAQGGGLYSNAGSLDISGSRLSNNLAAGGYGGYGNQVYGGAGGAGQGGGLYGSGGLLALSGSTVASNQATGGRGGDGGAGVSITNDGGPGGAGQGGGLYTTGSLLEISASSIASNQTTGGGGGNGGGPDPSGGMVGLGGPGGAGQGGALYASAGMLSISNATISGNTVRGGDGGNGGDGGDRRNGGAGNAGQGGGLYASGATTSLTNSTLSTNAARGGDGGNGGNGSYPGNGGNGGNGGAGQGGGLFGVGMVALTSSTISTNTVGGGAGGNGGSGLIFLRGGDGGNGGVGLGGGITVASGALDLTNSTVALNIAQASSGGLGGSGNPPGHPGTGQPGQGGGFRNGGGSVHALNTLFDDNSATSAPDFSGTLTSQGHNLIGDSSGGTGYADTDLLDVDPLLGPLQDNGGPTQTMALLAGSPAIDAGDNTNAPDWDQRGEGFPRIVNGIIDIGAFEYQGDGSAPLFTRSVRGNEPAVGTPFDVTVQPVDVFGQVAFGYTGMVTFSVTDTDPAVVLPADYTFTAGDQGTHTFTGQFTLITPRVWTLTTGDLANGLSQDVMMTVDS